MRTNKETLDPNPLMSIRQHPGNGQRNYIARLNPCAAKLISTSTKEIVFDKRNLTLRVPTIYDNKTYKLRSNQFSFGNMPEDAEPIGIYTLEKEEDIFILTKTTNL
jgi:hypothetical protein